MCMDRKDKKLIKGIIAMNIIVIIISIFLWARYNSYVGILITVISLWTSIISTRIIVNRYGVSTYCYNGNCIRDRLMRRLMKW